MGVGGGVEFIFCNRSITHAKKLTAAFITCNCVPDNILTFFLLEKSNLHVAM